MIDYITNNEVMYQKAYSLIEVSNHTNTKQQSELLDLINKYDELTIEIRTNMQGTPYEELVQWSNENDILILIGEHALMCIPKKDLIMINNMQA